MRLSLCVLATVFLSGCGSGPANSGGASPAGELQKKQAAELGVPAELTLEIKPGVPITFCLVPAGSFVIGSPANEAGRQSDEQQRPLQVGAFYMSKTEISQMQYSTVRDTNPSTFMGSTFPADSVIHDEALDFCAKLSALLKRPVKLPTEAQWEYACRAGTTTPYYNGSDETALQDAGWYKANSGQHTNDCGKKKANAWGLQDMHGNVWEWCADAAPSSQTPGANAIPEFVLRGGSWIDPAPMCRAAVRAQAARTQRIFIFGFRVVLPIETPKP